MQFLSSKMFSLQQRCYSTPKSASKLWVRNNSNQPTQVPNNSGAFYKTLVGIILKSDKTTEEKEDILASLLKEKEKQLEDGEKDLTKIE